jgi:hypothetical protein
VESDLSLSRDQLHAEVGWWLGYGRGSVIYTNSTWTTDQFDDIEACTKSGLRQFYVPPPVQGVVHRWSFLQPTMKLTVGQGSILTPLPPDFGGLEGEVSILSDGGVYCPLRVTAGIRQMAAESPDRTGSPLYVEIEPSRVVGPGMGQRQMLRVWPTPDASYVFQFRYYVLPGYLTDEAPYALGGAAHAETVRAAVLKAAEEFMDDDSRTWAKAFQERLAASIIMDRANKPQHLGYNADRSDGMDNGRYWRGWGRVTLNGTSMG